MNMIQSDFAEEQDRIKTIIKEKAEAAKIIDKEYNKRVNMYPASGVIP